MVTPKAALPPKVAGEHRWVALGTYTIKLEDAEAYHRGAEFDLDESALVAVGVGCVDCEAVWPEERPCSAPASPEMDFITSPSPFDPFEPQYKERLEAAVSLVERSGAQNLEVGYLDVDLPSHLGRWYAEVLWGGSQLRSDEHISPVEAVEALAWQLMATTTCERCERSVVRVGGPSSSGCCEWQRVGAYWVPGCISGKELEEFIGEARQARQN